MANTGTKIVLTLQEINDITGLPTGNTKPNVVTDPDYISPTTDLTECPITYDTTCPNSIITGGSGTLQYEFAVPTTVSSNPLIVKVRISAVTGTTVVTSTTIILPNTTGNYYEGTFSGLTAGTYFLRVEYINSSDVTINTCNGSTTTVVS